MDMMPPDRLEMTLRRERLADFYPLLQGGVRVPCRVGVNLENLLVDQWGIDAGYVAGRITTLFVNSRAVDNVATTMVTDGATVALSGAMPGLVGATMRRGGFYAAMRGAMTCRDDSGGVASGIGRVRVKLFNLLLGELGPALLGLGVVMTAAELSALVAAGEFSPEHFTLPPSLNGRPLDPDDLVRELGRRGGDELLVTVRFEEKS